MNVVTQGETKACGLPVNADTTLGIVIIPIIYIGRGISMPHVAAIMVTLVSGRSDNIQQLSSGGRCRSTYSIPQSDLVATHTQQPSSNLGHNCRALGPLVWTAYK
jgi:hypothetical protein